MRHLFRTLLTGTLLTGAALIARPAVAQHTLRFTSADNDQVAFATTQLNSGPFTYEIWAKYSAPQVASSYTTLFEYGNDNRAVFLGTDGTLSTYGASPNLYSTGPFPLQSWHHIAFTYDDITTEGTFYIDGILAGTGLTPFPNTTDTELGIGHHSSDPGWQGELDEVIIWNSVRTPAQIRADKNGQVTGTEPTLIAYLKFDEGSGQTLTNRKVGGNVAVLGTSTAVEQQDPQWTTNNAPLAVSAELAAARFELRVAPNPATGAAHLSYSLPTSAPVQVAILDATGRTVATVAAGNQSAGLHLLDLPVAGLPAGLYTCRLATDEAIAVRRLVLTQ